MNVIYFDVIKGAFQKQLKKAVYFHQIYLIKVNYNVQNKRKVFNINRQ